GPAARGPRRDPARPDPTGGRPGDDDPARLPRLPRRPDPGLGLSERSVSPDREQAGDAAPGSPSDPRRTLHVAVHGRGRGARRGLGEGALSLRPDPELAR